MRLNGSPGETGARGEFIELNQMDDRQESQTELITGRYEEGSAPIKNAERHITQKSFTWHGHLNGGNIGVLFTDFLIVGVTFALFIFISVIAGMNGRDMDAQFQELQSVLTTLGPIFPMVFAFVMSRFLYQLARSKLENGASLGTLEQLMGSHTLGSTFMIHFELRTLNILAVVLLCAWLLSPLGGQALLRILKEGTRSRDTAVSYIDTIREDRYTEFYLVATFLSAIFSAKTVKQGPEDLWGNVKIPFLNNNPTGASDEWTRVDYLKDETTFSALAGIPVANASIGNSTFTMESTYTSLSCNPFTVEEDETASNIPFTPLYLELETNMTDASRGSPRENGSWYGVHHKHDVDGGKVWWTMALDRFVEITKIGVAPHTNDLSLFEGYSSEDIEPARLLLQARTERKTEQDDTFLSVYKSECGVTQHYVESRVHCDQRRQTDNPPRSCQVVAQRSSQQKHAPEGISTLQFPYLFKEISEQLPLTMQRASQGSGGAMDPTLYYMYDRTMADFATSEPNQTFTDIAMEDFSINLSQLINTYLLLWQIKDSVHSQLWGDAFKARTQPNAYGLLIYQQTDAVTTSRVYGIAWEWMIPCLLCYLVLAIAGVLGVYFAHKGQGPELLGFVSTILRDSRYVSLPKGQKLHAHELSRLWKHERIRYGHVGQDDGEEPALGIGPEEQVAHMRRAGKSVPIPEDGSSAFNPSVVR